MTYKIFSLLATVALISCGSSGSNKGGTPTTLLPVDSTSSGSASSGSNSNSGSTTSSTTSSSTTSTTSSSSGSSSSSSGSAEVSSNVIWAINAGGSAATFGGTEFGADFYYEDGANGDTNDAIGGTELDALYQTERWGEDFTYEFPVEDGVYDVTLHMVELYWEASGERVQDVIIEGTTVLDNLDIFAEVGHDQALDRSFAGIVVNDGALTIRFVASSDAGNVAGITVSSDTGAAIDPADAPSPATTAELIKLNQLGFETNSTKIAIIPDITATEFNVVNTSNDTVAFTGTLSASMFWSASGTKVKQADLSSVTTPGTYRIEVAGVPNSADFEIGENIYADVHNAALKMYYYQRASTALEETYAGVWARPAGHPDDDVEIWPTAATDDRPAGFSISAPKGWYDAGDYNKYVVNAGISTYTLLAAYEHFSSFYDTLNTNIPESGNSVPDILDEIFWNLEWLEAMQDLDGGVYHKLTTQNFEAEVMPHLATSQRYVVQKGTAATLDFAAVMAVASRVYAPYEASFPGKAAAYRQAAIDAWNWAQTNSNVPFAQGGIMTGEYGDSTFTDEFAWAAAELFILTEDQTYLTAFKAQNASAGVPWWGGVAPLAFISLAEHGQGILSADDYNDITSALISLGDNLSAKQVANVYKVPMESGDYYWGSNSGALNQAFMALQAYRLTDDNKYLEVALASADYILGRNPTDFSFVTGFGSNAVNYPHHRPSSADGIAASVPGFVVGGPNQDAPSQDGCSGYMGTYPATTYVDSDCSYAANEVTINWNAPLVYMFAALQAE